VSLSLAVLAPARADITATWDGTTGNWTDSARWSGGVFPNNNAPDFYDVMIGAGAVTLNQNITINQLDLGGGTLAGSTPLTLVEGLAWSGGATLALSSGGNVTLGAGSTSPVTGAATFASGTIFGIGGATFAVQPGVTFTVLDGANFFAPTSIIAWTLTNGGTLIARNTGGAGFTTIDASLTNTGMLRVENTGSSHTLSLAGGGTLGGSILLEANTALELGGTLALGAGATFSGSGRVVTAGVVTLGGNVSIPNLSVAIGELRLAAHTLSVTGDAGVEDNGTLAVELRGTGAGQVSKLAVSDALDVFGTLQITLGGGFTPAIGDVFDVLDFGSVSGTFAVVQLPPLPAGRFWRTDRLYTDGELSVSSVPATYAEWQTAYGAGAFNADEDHDGIVNGLEYTFGRDPGSGIGIDGVTSMPRGSIAGDRLRLHFEMPEPGGNDITLSMQASDDLGLSDPWVTIATKIGTGAWSGPGAITLTPLPGGKVAVTIADTKLFSANPHRNLRLRVSLP
jgi:hypothetical protein